MRRVHRDWTPGLARKNDFNEIAQMVGRRVAELRNARGLTQQDLASLTGTSTQRISKVENGGANPTLKTIVDLTNALQVTFSELTLPPQTPKAGRGRPRTRK